MFYRNISRNWLPLCAAALLASAFSVRAELPEVFQGDTPGSEYSISYDDLDALLKATVLYTGNSNRQKAGKSVARTGTRMKANVDRLTVNEGNRFYFEAFKDNAELRQILAAIRTSLQQVPAEVKLSAFSKSEQLAYWLNLYNVTVLDELVKIYPQKNLESLVDGGESLFERKTLNVAGIALSLNDIQFNILQEKYNDPLVIYGLHQGYIGSPGIRKHAYTGKNVYRTLTNNAYEFINSNRGTYGEVNAENFRVSSFYQRSKAYFPNFEKDLTAHLLEHISGTERKALETASVIEADINNWNITDVYGTSRNYGAGLADNTAALIGSFSSGGTRGPEYDGIANLDSAAMSLQKLSTSYGRFGPDQIQRMRELDAIRVGERGAVTVTDIEDENN
ncbi:DUF547 domain-containing protein [Rheinheimera maricola]|uniref:DUF547 domain-containing protein n=1 Tax=Rheinheimera maricola TaxID=2793282 RepID=A0ABS7X8Z5_9GAMM|nr:DUF547 domain-containing protein [Rheinheimera maricola]MBZ9612023.1 DUF547 domain-containing protein [Rheinheimera maricola]